MTRLRLLLVFLLLASGALASQRTAQQARALLGPEIWARVLRIENAGRHSRYPATVYATVFEFAGILWFYTDTDGTQSLSLYRDQLDREKADIRPLLRAIDPGFGPFADVTDAGPRAGGAIPALPNGCFIESVAALEARLLQGERITRAALLCYYPREGAALPGHTVLAYETERGLFVIDPAQAAAPMEIGRGSLASAPLEIARATLDSRRSAQVASACWVPVALSRTRTPGPVYAALAPAARGAGTAPVDSSPARVAEG
jgi:hypothetical protein